MKVTILGSGPSGGVPLIGCECPVCNSNNLKNKRLRASIFIQDGDTHILVDTSPDLRQQALANGIKRVDAVLYTHAHADHTHGLDDIRSFNYQRNGSIPAYLDAATASGMRERFGYAFLEPKPQFGWFRPSLSPQEYTAFQPFGIGSSAIMPIPGEHGRSTSYSFRIGDFAYSTDVKRFSSEALAALKGVKTWIVDCLSITEMPTHAHLQQALEWIDLIKPERAYLTHMGHELEYDALCRELPPHIRPAYDGMSFDAA